MPTVRRRCESRLSLQCSEDLLHVHSTVQYSTVQYSVLSTVLSSQYTTVRYDTIQYNIAYTTLKLKLQASSEAVSIERIPLTRII